MNEKVIQGFLQHFASYSKISEEVAVNRHKEIVAGLKKFSIKYSVIMLAALYKEYTNMVDIPASELN